MDEEKKEEISALLKKGARSLREAEELLKLSMWEGTSSRAYYGAFHTVKALLLFKDLTFSKHKSVIGSFNKEFVHTGIFSKDLSQGMEVLFNDRQSGDYDPMPSITSEKAFYDLRTAYLIHNTIKEWLEKEIESKK